MRKQKQILSAGGATMILDTQSRLAYHHHQELLSVLAPDYVY